MRSHSDGHSATPPKSILRPETSSHTTTPPEANSSPILLAPSVRTNHPKANPASGPSTTSLNAFADLTSDEEDEFAIQGLDHSLKQSEPLRRTAVTSLKERGDRYKQLSRLFKQQLSDLRLENAEALRELAERAASKPMSKDEKTMDGLTTAKEKAEIRWKTYKGQLKEAISIIRDLRNQVAYIKTVLEFEEKSGYSSAMSALQLDNGGYSLSKRLYF